MRLIAAKLVWVLMLTLPLQAFAQAHMSLCMALMSAPRAVSVQASEAISVATSASMQVDCAGHTAADHTANTGDDPEQNRCGNCALCLIGAVVVAHFTVSPPLFQAGELAPQPVSLYVDAALRLLDDPPRT